MQVPVDHKDQGVGAVPQSTITPNWRIHVSDVRNKLLHNCIDYHLIEGIYESGTNIMFFTLDAWTLQYKHACLLQHNQKTSN